MKTTILKMCNGKKTITLVGTTHIGSEKYYNALKGHITGEKVLYEMVKRSEGYDISALGKGYEQIANALGLASQRTQFGDMYKQDNYINVDIEMGDIIEFSTNDSMIKRMTEKNEDIFNDDKFLELLNFPIVKKLIMLMIHLAPLFSRFQLSKDRHIVVDFRNSIAIHGIMEACRTSSDVTLIYGEGHIHGLQKFLKKCGYTVVQKIKYSMTM